MSNSTAPVESIAHVRNRPGMYVGGTDLFGLINYLVCPFNLLLSHGASWIDTEFDDGTFEIVSDAKLPIEETSAGIIPFEVFHGDFTSRFNGPVFAALSHSLTASVTIDQQSITLKYNKGERVSKEHQKSGDGQSPTKFTFVPEHEIFHNTDISSQVIHSYLHRISHLHAGVRFRLTIQGETTEYFSAHGIADLFHSFSAPFQILHQPIHIQAQSGTLHLELIFAFGSWSDNWVLSFINNGRAVEGGSHETALFKAFDELKVKLHLPSKSNGVIAIMSMIYPDVVWYGCIKRKIVDRKLYNLIKRLVIEEVTNWINLHPATADHLTRMQIFEFPESWYESRTSK